MPVLACGAEMTYTIKRKNQKGFSRRYGTGAGAGEPPFPPGGGAAFLRVGGAGGPFRNGPLRDLPGGGSFFTAGLWGPAGVFPTGGRLYGVYAVSCMLYAV